MVGDQINTLLASRLLEEVDEMNIVTIGDQPIESFLSREILRKESASGTRLQITHTGWGLGVWGWGFGDRGWGMGDGGWGSGVLRRVGGLGALRRVGGLGVL